MTHKLQTLLVAGATGLVGHEVLRQALALPGLKAVYPLLRKPPGHASPDARVQPRVVDYTRLPALPHADAALCALGTTIKVAGSQAAFRAVDFDAVLAFGRAAQAAGVRRFAVVSALGAGPRSSVFYNRVKGEMEEALRGLGFGSLVIARPSLLVGDRAALGQPVRGAERLGLLLGRPLTPLIPPLWRPIDAEVVARALLRALQSDAPGVQVLDSAQLQQQGRA
jgi:uncharacterized protein YbjT (DUF2867 family)